MVESIHFYSFSPVKQTFLTSEKVSTTDQTEIPEPVNANNPSSPSRSGQGDLWVEQQAAMLRHFYVTTGQVAFTYSGSGVFLSEPPPAEPVPTEEVPVELEIATEES